MGFPVGAHCMCLYIAKKGKGRTHGSAPTRLMVRLVVLGGISRRGTLHVPLHCEKRKRADTWVRPYEVDGEVDGIRWDFP